MSDNKKKRNTADWIFAILCLLVIALYLYQKYWR